MRVFVMCHRLGLPRNHGYASLLILASLVLGADGPAPTGQSSAVDRRQAERVRREKLYGRREAAKLRAENKLEGYLLKVQTRLADERKVGSGRTDEVAESLELLAALRLA